MFYYIDIYSFIPPSGCVGMGISALLCSETIMLLRPSCLYQYCFSLGRYKFPGLPYEQQYESEMLESLKLHSFIIQRHTGHSDYNLKKFYEYIHIFFLAI